MKPWRPLLGKQTKALFTEQRPTHKYITPPPVVVKKLTKQLSFLTGWISEGLYYNHSVFVSFKQLTLSHDMVANYHNDTYIGRLIIRRPPSVQDHFLTTKRKKLSYIWVNQHSMVLQLVAKQMNKTPVNRFWWGSSSFLGPASSGHSGNYSHFMLKRWLYF